MFYYVYGMKYNLLSLRRVSILFHSFNGLGEKDYQGEQACQI